MFGSKLVNVEEYLNEIEHNLKSSKINFDVCTHKANKIYDFIKYFIAKRYAEIHVIKLGHLRNAEQHLHSFVVNCYDKKINEATNDFNLIKAELMRFASFGEVYLLRHADKPKADRKSMGFEMSELGVKQAKHVAEMIEEEILLVPKPVVIKVHCSEQKRTAVLGRVMKFLNNAHKIGKKDITIMGPTEDQRLFMGNFSDDAMKFLTEHLKNEGEVKTYLEWVKAEQGVFGDLIKSGKLQHPKISESSIHNFVATEQQETFDSNHYTIIIGVSHSWTIDVWLMHYTGIQEIISTAEYAKVERGSLYYKGKWFRI